MTSKPTAPKQKIDLSILKRMVAEVEVSLASADSKDTSTTGALDRLVELNKATGLITGIVSECILLAGDVQVLAQSISGGGASTLAGTQELLNKLGLGGFKGSGGTN